MLFITVYFDLNKQFEDLSLEKKFDTGIWSLSDPISVLEGGNSQISKYFMKKIGVSFVSICMPVNFVFLRGP